jgi:hypothetical protein
MHRLARPLVFAALCSVAAVVPAVPPQPDEAARALATQGLRKALNEALQANASAAIGTLRKLDPALLDAGQARIHGCMLDRLEARRPPSTVEDDPFLSDLGAAFAEYWMRSLRQEFPATENDASLLAALNAAVVRAGGKTESTLDALEPAVETLALARGRHVLLGTTRPLRDLMLWKTESLRHYQVALPDGVQTVAVVFMDDFTSLGWSGFATCDRHHSGGWAKPDRLYAVRDAYDTDSEGFRVSYLAHEGQHHADQRRFPSLDAQEELEFRAKLAELALAKDTVHDLLDQFASNAGDDRAIPHSYANARVMRVLQSRLFPSGSPSPWIEVAAERINAAASELLREDTASRTAPPSP